MNKRLAAFNILALVATIFVNFLANALPLNGKNTGQLSDGLPNLFVPAGLTFSIWGVIYSLLLVWGGFQIAGFFNKNVAEKIAPTVGRTGWFFVATCILNIAWLFAWHWQKLGVSVVVMVVFLVGLVFLNRNIGNGTAPANLFEKRWAHPVFGIYQGWITVALIANVTGFLVSKNWSGGGIAPEIWTVLVIWVGAILAGLVVWTRLNIFHGLAVVWAFLGIFIKRNALSDADLVKNMALAAMLFVLVLVALRAKKWWDLLR